MYDISEFKINLNPGLVDRVQLIRAIRQMVAPGEFSIADCTAIAWALMRGETWKPTPSMLSVDPRKSAFAELCSIEYETLYEAFRSKTDERDANIKALIEAGAAGDAEAAIALAQGIKDGRFWSYFQPSAG